MVRMIDIAERAGVSRATVSHILNGRTEGFTVREETRQRVLKTADELGYRNNELAKAVVTGKTYVFGFFSHAPSEETSHRILIGAQDEADRHGYLIKLLPAARNGDYSAPIKKCIEQRVAGVLVTNDDPSVLDQLHSEATRFDIPIALLENCPPRPWGVRITSDSHQGIGLALKHLIDLGHRHIGFVSSQAGAAVAENREKSFVQWMQNYGLLVVPAQIIHTHWDDENIIEPIVCHWLQNAVPRPTALLCAGDRIALVSQRAARSLGLNLPTELSVVGFANFTMARYSDPALTTVAQPFEEMGRVAVRQLLKITSSGNDTGSFEEGSHFALPNSLVVRASTASAPG